MILDHAKMITPNIRHLAIRCKDGNALPFTPGQFITIHFIVDGTPFRRSYSIASKPEQADCLEFAASYVKDGPGTDLLFNLQPGDKLQITGPHGRLILRDEQPKRLIFVSTGTGVTPYRAMLNEFSKRLKDQDLKITLLQGVREPDELLYGQDFIEFAEATDNFEFLAFYSRKQPTEPKHFEFEGYVQHYFPELDLNPDNDIIYLCGNPGMIDESFELLKCKGFATQQVRREKYISAKTPKLQIRS